VAFPSNGITFVEAVLKDRPGFECRLVHSADAAVTELAFVGWRGKSLAGQLQFALQQLIYCTFQWRNYVYTFEHVNVRNTPARGSVEQR
jgi:hypothetical protein